MAGAVMGGTGKDMIWLCKICAEEKDMWKKSGAWFFKVRISTRENHLRGEKRLFGAILHHK